MLILKTEAFGSQAEGLCKYEGKVVFIPGALPGETIEAVIVKVQKTHAFGKLIRIINQSSQRIVPPCPYYPQCGGCSCQHMNYETELKFKQTFVRDALKHLGGIDFDVPEVIGMKDPWHYRNKTSQPVVKQNGEPVCGYGRAATDPDAKLGACLKIYRHHCSHINHHLPNGKRLLYRDAANHDYRNSYRHRRRISRRCRGFD